MDYKFWLALLVAGLSVWFGWQQVRVGRQALAHATGAPMKNNGTLFRRLWLPALILSLSVVNWVPYVFPRAGDNVTIENIQSNVRHWLDTFHLASQELADSASYFVYAVTLADGRRVRLERTKEYDKYITFTSSITTDKSAQDLFDSFTERDRNRIKQELILDLSRAKIAMFVDDHLRVIGMSTRLPITTTLSEADFIGRIDEMDFAAAGVLATLVTNLPSIPAPSAK